MPQPKATAPIRMTFNPAATCRDEQCGWSRGDNPVTRDEAKQHTIQTGHETEVVVEDVTVYRREPAMTAAKAATPSVAEQKSGDR